MKNSKINRKIIFMIAVSLIFLLYILLSLIILQDIEFIYLFSYVFYKDWFIEPVIALYLILMGILLLTFKIRPLIKIVTRLFIGIVGIGLTLLLILGIAFGFANKAYEVEDTEVIIVRTQSMVDFYYDVYEIKSGVFAKQIAELNSMIYPSIIDRIESEFNGNEFIVKIVNHDIPYEIHLYFDIVDDTYILVDEIKFLKQ